MNRKLLVNLHLVTASFLLPFLILIPVSGTAYLLGEKGSQVTERAFLIEAMIPAREPERSEFFREQFRENGIDFDFEYIREAGKTLTFRPSSRDHYVAQISETGAEIVRIQPDFWKKLIELHKGHGPGFFKTLQIVFGLGLLAMAGSGVMLAFGARQLRRTMLISLAAGTILVILALTL